MTPEQIDAATNGLINAHAFLADHGPELAAAIVLLAVWWAARRINTRHAQRRQLARERQQTARLRNAIDAAPLIPTLPGQDDDLLDQCWASWNATENRKETQQP